MPPEGRGRMVDYVRSRPGRTRNGHACPSTTSCLVGERPARFTAMPHTRLTRDFHSKNNGVISRGVCGPRYWY